MDSSMRVLIVETLVDVTGGSSMEETLVDTLVDTLDTDGC